MKKTLTLAALALSGVLATSAFAQSADSPQTAELKFQVWMDKIKSEKKFIVIENLPLTDTEGKAFWPVYDEYQKGLLALYDRSDKMILSYAEAYRKNMVTDEKAGKLVDEWTDIQNDVLTLQKSYLPKFKKALPAVKVMRYLQIENKLRTMTMMDLTTQIPLVK